MKIELKTARDKLNNENLKEVAEKIGIHYNTLYKFMRGCNNITLKTLEKINNYLMKD
jgi:DNA-binding Xre family transcriptional regulator